jgi:hypothetical protein
MSYLNFVLEHELIKKLICFFILRKLTKMKYLLKSDHKEYCQLMIVFNIKLNLPCDICKIILDFTVFNKEYYKLYVTPSPFYLNGNVMYDKIKSYYNQINNEVVKYYFNFYPSMKGFLFDWFDFYND